MSLRIRNQKVITDRRYPEGTARAPRGHKGGLIKAVTFMIPTAYALYLAAEMPGGVQ